MTEVELLTALVESSERVEFYLHTLVWGLAWVVGATMLGGWLYARRDSIF